jgi:glycosyltransferase involved in cell wall biosynthesis
MLTTAAVNTGAPKTVLTRAPARVALICDYLEEQWPSMDLVGEMLCTHLAQDHAGEIESVQLRPALRRRMTRIPMLGGKVGWSADRLINRFVDYPRWLRSRQRDFDLFHLVDHSYSQLVPELPPGRTVVTCHDLDTFRCILQPEEERRPFWFRAMTRRILDGFRRATHVIAVSQATRDAIVRHDLVPGAKITVIPNGVHPSYSPLPDPAADSEALRLLPQNSPDTVWLLNVGSVIPRKRIDLLLQVYAAVQSVHPSAKLARVGGNWTAEHRRMAAQAGINLERDSVALPFLERNLLAAVYRRAAMLLHTADAEGFGLPLIEASACGCPVIASDLPVLREVGGAAAVFCPVGNIPVWTNAILVLMEERASGSGDWVARRHRAMAHARSYSWSRNAQVTACLYRQIYERKGI